MPTEERVADEADSLIGDGASTVGGTGVADQDHADAPPKADASKDIPSILLLLLLYTLQGIPMGLAGAVPIMLQSRGFGFSSKAVFSFAAWPYSLKLLWSPIVDAVYSPRWGRRKSWVVPVQLATGALMLVMGPWVDEQLLPGRTIAVGGITAAFFALYFLVATQDIAVDGWALTMLRPENVGFASVCNSVGQTAGMTLSYALLLGLGDGAWCDAHLRAPGARTGEPMVTIGGFLAFWGAVLVAVTAGIAVFKSERPARLPDRPGGAAAGGMVARAIAALRHSYHDAWLVLTLPNVLLLVLILLTARLAFSGVDAGLDIELLQKGVPRQTLVTIGLVYTPFELVFSMAASRWTAGDRPLGVWLAAYPARILLSLAFAVLVASAPDVLPGQLGSLSTAWYMAVTVLFVCIRLLSNVMFVGQMAFFNRVADPAMGGTYMTLLNTITNLGAMWPSFLTLQGMAAVEQTGCYPPPDPSATTWLPFVTPGIVAGTAMPIPPDASGKVPSCATVEGVSACAAIGGSCAHAADGFPVVSLLCLGAGLVWLAIFLPRIHDLEGRPRDGWLIARDGPAPRDVEE